jgi:hypothetical protein
MQRREFVFGGCRRRRRRDCEQNVRRVADLERARRLVERGLEIRTDLYAGLLGEAFLAPTREDPGMLIEFHSLARSPAPPCGGPSDAAAASGRKP